MGIGAGFFGTLFSVINGNITHSHDSQLITAYEMISVGVMVEIFWGIGVFNEFFGFIPIYLDWVWIGIRAVVYTVNTY